jgi:hypothetical protein
MEKRVTWIDHKGSEILRFNAGGATRNEQLALLEDYAKALKSRPGASVRLLFIGGEIEFHPELITKGKSVFNELEDRILRSATVGLSGVLKMAVKTYREAASLLGREMVDKAVPFDSEEAAMDWLVQN